MTREGLAPTLACEQALCLGEKIARKGKGKRFSLSPPRSTKGLFTGYSHAGVFRGARFFKGRLERDRPDEREAREG